MIPSRWVQLLVVGAVGLVLGLGAGWKLWRVNQVTPETYAREQRQSDGSLILEKKPQSDAKPAQEIPKGGAIERVIQVSIKPKPLDPIPMISSPMDAPGILMPGSAQPVNAPIRVDLTLVRMPDGTRRVLASSPDGEIVGGVDIPVESATSQKPLRWTASILRTWEPTTGKQGWGGQLQRNMGPFVVGVGGFQGTVFATAGVRW